MPAFVTAHTGGKIRSRKNLSSPPQTKMFMSRDNWAAFGATHRITTMSDEPLGYVYISCDTDVAVVTITTNIKASYCPYACMKCIRPRTASEQYPWYAMEQSRDVSWQFVEVLK